MRHLGWSLGAKQVKQFESKSFVFSIYLTFGSKICSFLGEKHMLIQFCFGAVKHLALVFLMAFALVGCGGGSSDTTNAADSTPTPAAAETPATETTTVTTAAETPPAVNPPDAGSRLHLVFQTLNKGMTKAEVRAFVGVPPTIENIPGLGLYWQGSDGGLAVYFDYHKDPNGIIAIAEWGYLQPTSRPNETRNLR